MGYIALQASLPWNFPGKNTGVSCHLLLQGSSWPRGWTHISWVSCIGRQILYHCATWEAPERETDVNIKLQTASEYLFCPKVTCRGTLGKCVTHSYEVLISLKSLVSLYFIFSALLSWSSHCLGTWIYWTLQSFYASTHGILKIIFTHVCVSHSVVSNSLWPQGL